MINGHFRNHYLLSSISSSRNKSRRQQSFGEKHQTIITSNSLDLDSRFRQDLRMRLPIDKNDFIQTSPVKQQKSRHSGPNTILNGAAPVAGNNIINNDHRIRNFSQLSKQQQRCPPSLASIASGMEQGCATSISIGGDSSTPEATANAMANVVRLILLILICVLLVKLRAPKGSRRSKGRAKSNNDDYDSQYINNHDDLDSMSGSKSNHIYDSRGNLTNYKNQQPNNQLRRKISHPELVSDSRLKQGLGQNNKGEYERQRRHSDTCLAHLKLPPGPMGLPFLGYLPFISKEIHLTLTSLSERYGPIYQIFLGGIRVVVLNDASLVRQAFKQPVFSGRPDTQLTRILQGYGIVNSDGALWKEQRAFLHTALRKLGAKSLMNGSNGLEAKIQHQVKEFVNDLSGNAMEGKPCQVRPIVARAVSSVVGSIVMNLTYRKYEEKEKFDRLIELMQEGFRLFTIAMPLDFIPIFRFLPGVSYAYKKMKRNRAETSAFFQGVADEHRKYLSETFNLCSSRNPPANEPLHPRSNTDSAPPAASSATGTAAQQRQQQHQSQFEQSQQQLGDLQPHPSEGSHLSSGSPLGAGSLAAAGSQNKQHVELENIVARDLVDAYIVQQKKHEKDGKENYFSDQQLVQIMSDIFSAGLETVTSTIEWSILFLILNTECQDLIQQEIDRVIGRERMPQLEDLSQMAYTEATIYEVLRRSNVIALGNAHATLDDASIGGYRIPKGTQVLPNLYCIHMNPKLWHEPEKFQPSRFIVNDKAQKPDYFIPFSVGRRMCLGDVLAKMEVFLFLVGLLQKYDLSVPEEDRHCPPQIKGTIGVSNTPASFRVALRKRGEEAAAASGDRTMCLGGDRAQQDRLSAAQSEVAGAR